MALAEVPARVVSQPAPPTPAQAGDTIGACPLLGPHTGFAGLEQTLLECAPGRSHPRATGDGEEALR